MISVLISSESRYPISRPKIKAKIEEILSKFGVDDVEVSLSVVGDRKMKHLNQQYRQKDETTNVLSFPLEEPRGGEGILRLGDIIVSYPEAQKEALEENKFIDEVLLMLVEHGLMHLLGFNHDNGSEFKISSSKNFGFRS